MKALVTGASGFVGSTLCEELNRRGVDVKVLMRKSSSQGNLSQSRFTPVYGDLRDAASLLDAVSGVDVIFHVAGVVSAKNREDYFRSNAEGTANLVQAAKRNGQLKRFIYVSSLAAAGPSSPEKARIEEDISSPISYYGESKLAGEQEALQGADDFSVVIVRPPSVYGPRDRGIYTFFQTIERGFLPLLGMQKKDPRRYSFVHVDDLVQGIVLAGTADTVSNRDIFYISGEGEFSWEEAMRLIAEGMEKKALPLRLPLPVMKGVAAACSLASQLTKKPLPLSLDKMKEIESLAWTCSNKKAKQKLGFAPYWDLRKGFAQTARWYKENSWL